jgi:hypothetical protein
VLKEIYELALALAVPLKCQDVTDQRSAKPSSGGGGNPRRRNLALGVLGAFSRLVTSVFFSLDSAWVARDKAGFFQR